ncbi:MAG: hypothetical protein M1561_05730 [Gammaproteobacteria bacterium]|nr:hypothetical protein [Gammaproteobacteria bacterium]
MSNSAGAWVVGVGVFFIATAAGYIVGGDIGDKYYDNREEGAIIGVSFAGLGLLALCALTIGSVIGIRNLILACREWRHREERSHLLQTQPRPPQYTISNQPQEATTTTATQNQYVTDQQPQGVVTVVLTQPKAQHAVVDPQSLEEESATGSQNQSSQQGDNNDASAPQIEIVKIP